LMTTLHLEVKDRAGKSLKDGTYEKTSRYGELLADAADRALASAKPIKTAPLQYRAKLIYPPIQNKYFQLARQLGVLDRTAFVGGGASPKPAGPMDLDKPLFTQSEIAWLR